MFAQILLAGVLACTNHCNLWLLIFLRPSNLIVELLLVLCEGGPQCLGRRSTEWVQWGAFQERQGRYPLANKDGLSPIHWVIWLEAWPLLGAPTRTSGSHELSDTLAKNCYKSLHSQSSLDFAFTCASCLRGFTFPRISCVVHHWRHIYTRNIDFDVEELFVTWMKLRH